MSNSNKESSRVTTPRTETLKNYLKFLGIRDNEQLCFVAVHPRSEAMRRAETAACFVNVKTAPLALRAAEDIEPKLNAEGLYLMPGKIHPDVSARDLPTSWTPGVEQPKDHEIVQRRVVVVDLDPRRIRGVSSTDEELSLAHAVAEKVYEALKTALGSALSLALACSGNGYHVLIAVDLDTETDGRAMTDPARPLIEKLLGALALRYGTDRVDVDRSVVEARRLFPAYGTTKCKGKNTEERPHRLTTFPVVKARPPRLGLEQFSDLVDAVAEDLSDDQKAALENSPKGTATKRKTRSAPRTEESDLDICSKVPMAEVLAALGEDTDNPTCPSCGAGGTKGDSSVKVLSGKGDGEVLNCLHGTCGGWAGGVVKLVGKTVAGVDTLKGDKEAIERVIQWFKDQGLADVPARKKGGRPPRVYSDEEIERMGVLDEPIDLSDLDLEDNSAANDAEACSEVDEGAEVEPRSFNSTDAGNAERLVARCGKDIRYIPEWKCWLVWDGKRWVRDLGGLMMDRLALETVRAMYEDALTFEGAQRRETVRWAKTSEGQTPRNSMVRSAQHMCAAQVESLNQDPWLINTPSGTVEMKTGTLREHRREDYITMITTVGYDPKADRSLVDAFLERSQPDPEMRAYIWRLQGYAATGDTSEHAFAIHHGSGTGDQNGRNGKGTLLNSCVAVLGDYAGGVSEGVTVGMHKGEHPTTLTTLFGLRYALGPETKERAKLNVTQMKTLASDDVITARRIGENEFSFTPTHFLQIPTNYPPLVDAPASDPIWERMHLVPWLVHIPKAERDKSLGPKLKTDPGLLRALVEGCVDYVQNGGLEPPSAVQEAILSYQEESDKTGRFVGDSFDLSTPDAFTPNELIYKVYSGWCDAEGIRALARNNLSSSLNTAKAGTPGKQNGVRGRFGVKLRPEALGRCADPVDELTDEDLALAVSAPAIKDFILARLRPMAGWSTVEEIVSACREFSGDDIDYREIETVLDEFDWGISSKRDGNPMRQGVVIKPK